MGVYINNEVILQQEKEKQDELDKAQMMLEIADKDVKIQNLMQENAELKEALAILVGGPDEE